MRSSGAALAALLLLLLDLAPISSAPMSAQTAPAPAKSIQPPIASTHQPSGSPVGSWIAHHPSSEDLGLWWNFHADGSVSATAGVIANSHYKLEGTTLTISGSNQLTAGVFEIRFTEGKLYTTAHADRPTTMEFARLDPRTDPQNDPQTGSASPIVGTWKLLNAPHATDPQQEEARTRMLNMIVIYRADGTYQARLPVQTSEGRWDAAHHTYQLKGLPSLHYERVGRNLKIATPPAGKYIHLYFEDSAMVAASLP